MYNGNKINKEIIANYLLSEFDILHQRADEIERSVAKKTDFFIALTTAILGGFVVIFGKQMDEKVTFFVLLIALILLQIFGWTIFKQSVDLSTSSTLFYRRAGRIRRWFLDNSPGIERYVPFPVTDELPPLYVSHSPMRYLNTTVVGINAALLALFVMVLFWLYGNLNFFLIGILGTIAFIFMFYLQFSFYRNHLQKREEKERREGKIHFPRQHDERKGL